MLEIPATCPLGIVQSVFLLPGELRITEGLGTESVKIRPYVRLLLGKQSTLNFKWKGLYDHRAVLPGLAETDRSSFLKRGKGEITQNKSNIKIDSFLGRREGGEALSVTYTFLPFLLPSE